MVRNLFSAVAALAAISVVDAVAQQSDPIMDAYRGYTSALQRGDQAAAEGPAAAALAASQAQFGEGHRTPVLALNLARLRLALGKPAEAHDPAALALHAAQQQGPASGVDLLMAEITVARSELATDPLHGSDHLSSVLAAASGRADVDADAYAGATELGRWARTSEHYLVMRSAYEGAIAHAAGAPDNPALARGVALAAVGSSIILNQRLAQMPTRGPSPAPARAAMQEAHAILRQAMVELWPLAQHDNPNGELTIEQTAFARAMAWHTLARLRGNTPPDEDVQNQIGVVSCHYHIDHPSGYNASYYPPALDAAKRRVS